MSSPVCRLATLAFAASLPFAAAFGASVAGIPNYHEVNSRIARGGQPSGEGFRNLAAEGFRTIVDLREKDERAKDEKKLVEALGMKYVNIPMKGMKTPDDKQVARALRVLNEDKASPVFIHCKRGADRTGLVMAVYRIEHDNWSNADALREARDHGMYWYQFPLIRYVSEYRPHSSSFTGRAGDLTEAGREFGEDAIESVKKLPQAIGGLLH